MEVNRTLVGLQQGIAIALENISSNITVATKLIDIYAMLDERGSTHYARQLVLLQSFVNFYSTQQPRQVAPMLPPVQSHVSQSSLNNPLSSQQSPHLPPSSMIDELAVLEDDHPAAELFNALSKSFEEEDNSIAKHIENCRKACEEEMKNMPPPPLYVPKEDHPAPPTVHVEEECLSETETVNSISPDDRKEFLSNLTDDRQNKLLAVIHHLAKEEIDKYKVPEDKKEDLIMRAANRIRDNYIKTKGRSICLDNYTL